MCDRTAGEEFSFPKSAGRAFHKNGMMIAVATLIGFALLFWAARAMTSLGGQGFYAVLSHNAMVAIFAPGFCFSANQYRNQPTSILAGGWRGSAQARPSENSRSNRLPISATSKAGMEMVAISKTMTGFPMLAGLHIKPSCTGSCCALLPRVLPR